MIALRFLDRIVDGVERNIMKECVFLVIIMVLLLGMSVVDIGILDIIVCIVEEVILMIAIRFLDRIVDGVEIIIMMDFVYLVLEIERGDSVSTGRVEVIVCIVEDLELVVVIVHRVSGVILEMEFVCREVRMIVE